MPPRLSVVVLTWNEAGNIGPALRALARQRERGFELIVIDAASTDGTVPAIEAERPNIPVPLRLVVADTRLPIGEARNRGVSLAKAPFVAFLSADAQVDEGWTQEVLRTLESGAADMVFGQQVHAPHAWTIGASVRGSRYHFPDGESSEPLRFASNVAAGYRREILQRFPFDPWANAAEDLLLAKRAAAAGYTAAYNPRMLVRHHDVATWRQEWRKNVREGYGWALYADEIGHLRQLLVWGALIAGAIGAAVAAAALGLLGIPLAASLGVLALAGVLWLPAARRVARRWAHMPPRGRAKAFLFGPIFDLAFLVQYLRGLTPRKTVPAKASTPTPSSLPSPELQETQA